MPTYDYECAACGYRFDELQRFSDPPLTKCPKCQKDELVRLFGGGGAVIFKGSGFYETDYRRSGQKNEGSENTDRTNPETKSESSPGSGAKTDSPSAADPNGGKSSASTGAKQKAK
jgi:putative FmdB family regulatory protein